jgi:hypothetical protein
MERAGEMALSTRPDWSPTHIKKENRVSTYELYHLLCNAGFDPLRVSKAIDILHGEPAEPAADDFIEYHAWRDRLDSLRREEDARAEADMARRHGV